LITHVPAKTNSRNNRRAVFSLWSGPWCYKNDEDDEEEAKGGSNYKRPTRPLVRDPQVSDSNKNLFVSPRWVLYSKTDWPTDRRSQHKTRLV
jgi:hypothetical protein